MVLEILISTMHRKDLSFLNKMFANNTITDFQILIINQTSKAHILKSELSNIRVINSFEKGLSKSRNLAIENALGDICLIADDDVEYVKGFDKIIKEAYMTFSDAECVVFNADISGKVKNPKYLNASKKINKIKECVSVSSVEMSFKRQPIQMHKIRFNELLGLNGVFVSGEEFVFLNEVLRKMSIYYHDAIILTHKNLSTGAKLGLKQIVPIYAVQYHLVYPKLFYYRLMRLMLYLLIKHKIAVSDIFKMLSSCLKARKKYIELKGNS